MTLRNFQIREWKPKEFDVVFHGDNNRVYGSPQSFENYSEAVDYCDTCEANPPDTSKWAIVYKK
jgi:hypothetical protein